MSSVTQHPVASASVVSSVAVAGRRLRRLRATSAMRELVAEVNLRPAQLISPYFVVQGQGVNRPVASMPGVAQLSIDHVLKSVEADLKTGIKAVMLFGVIEDAAQKCEAGQQALNETGIIPQALQALRTNFGQDVVLMSDTCLCDYTSHGHCGLVEAETILNDESLLQLAQAAVVQAQAGADVVCPSDMMDGRIAVIRDALDDAGCSQTSIMAYAVKYASSLYGPFRDAALSAPSFGDRRSYQMDARRGVNEALLALAECEAQGADMIMVKPALGYQDILQTVAQNTLLPVCAYSVSGEYAMIKAAAQQGWLNEEAVMMELMLGIRRSGAQMIVTYFAQSLAKMLQQH